MTIKNPSLRVKIEPHMKHMKNIDFDDKSHCPVLLLQYNSDKMSRHRPDLNMHALGVINIVENDEGCKFMWNPFNHEAIQEMIELLWELGKTNSYTESAMMHQD